MIRVLVLFLFAANCLAKEPGERLGSNLEHLKIVLLEGKAVTFKSAYCVEDSKPSAAYVITYRVTSHIKNPDKTFISTFLKKFEEKEYNDLIGDGPPNDLKASLGIFLKGNDQECIMVRVYEDGLIGLAGIRKVLPGIYEPSEEVYFGAAIKNENDMKKLLAIADDAIQPNED